MEYHVGDKVWCRTSSDGAVIFDVDFNDKRYRQFRIRTYEVIGFHDKRYYILLVPSMVDASFELTDDILLLHGLPAKYLSRYGFLLREEAVGGRQKVDFYRDACMCCACKQYVPYAEPNQADGRFACYSCKTDERYKVIYKIK